MSKPTPEQQEHILAWATKAGHEISDMDNSLCSLATHIRKTARVAVSVPDPNVLKATIEFYVGGLKYSDGSFTLHRPGSLDATLKVIDENPGSPAPKTLNELRQGERMTRLIMRLFDLAVGHEAPVTLEMAASVNAVMHGFVTVNGARVDFVTDDSMAVEKPVEPTLH